MSKLSTMLYLKALSAKEKLGKAIKSERGDTNIIALVLILAVVIALVVIFRKYLGQLFETIWGKMTGDVSEALK